MTDMGDVEAVVLALGRVRNVAELESILSDSCKLMGFDYYALVHHVDLAPVRPDLDPLQFGLIAISNYPEGWIEAYIARNMALTDPVHLASHRTPVGFLWDDVPRFIEVTSAHRAVRDDTLRAGLDQGFTIPINIPGEANGSCSFAMKAGRRPPLTRLLMAQLIGLHAFETARRLALRVRDVSALRRRSPLPPRQLDCILLVGRGYNNKQIGKRLGIAEETVKWYLKNAAASYGAHCRGELVLHAVFDGQLSIADIFCAPPPRTGG